MTTPNVLDRAADLLAETGWCRYKLTASDGQHCLLGVLQASGADDRASTAVAHECCARFGVGSFITANDEHIKNQAEAIDVLRAAARRLDGAG